jgi:hypothetical protein
MPATLAVSDPVFTRPNGRLISRQYFLAYIWKPAPERAGVKKGTVHDLRHTPASLAIMSGQSIVEVRGFLGHCSVAVTDRYSHMIDQRRRALADAMDGYMGATLGATPSGKPAPEGQGRGNTPPSVLPGQKPFYLRAGEGNRTLMTSLEGWSSTIELHPQHERRP